MRGSSEEKPTKTTSAPCRNRLGARGDRFHHPHKFCDAIVPRITKISTRRTNLVCSIVQSSTPKNNCARNDEMFAKTRSARSTNRFYSYRKRWSLFALVNTCVGITTSQSETEHAFRRAKEGTVPLGSVGSFRKVAGRSNENFFETFKTKSAYGKSPCERRFGTSFDGPVINPISTKGKSRFHQSGTDDVGGNAEQSLVFEWKSRGS